MRHKNYELLEDIVRYVNDYCSEYGRGPSSTMVAEKFNLSRAGAFNYLAYLEEKGRLAKDYNNSYISNALSQSNDTTEVPLLGYIPCGPLEEIIENAEAYIRLPRSLTGSGKYFLLRAHGESMINAGINDGDLVLIEQSKNAEVGNIIVALVDNEVTLKRLKYNEEKQAYYLHPENEKLDDIYVKNLTIQGIAKKVIKVKDLV